MTHRAWKFFGLRGGARPMVLATLLAMATQATAVFGLTIELNAGDTFTVGSATGPSISGFADFTTNGTAAVNPGDASLTLTTGVIGEAGSAWTTGTQSFSATDGFSASFIYTAGGDRLADGITFTIQNDPSGTAALGVSGGGLGYQGINNSASYQLNIFGDFGSVLNVNGLTGHTGGTPYNFTSGVDPTLGHPMAITLSYANGSLVETMTDTVVGGAYVNSFSLDLPEVLGGTTGRLGFTGATGGFTASQTVSGFTYTSGPLGTQSVSADSVTVHDGGLLTGVGGSLGAPTWLMDGGAMALAGTAISFDTFTQTGGRLAVDAMTVAPGSTYSLQAGTATMTAMTIQPNGEFAFSGGNLRLNTLSIAGTFQWTGGDLYFVGDQGFAVNANVALAAGQNLHVANTTTIVPGSTLTLNGGFFETGSVTLGGALSLQTGTFNLNNEEFTLDGASFPSNIIIGPQMTVNINFDTIIPDGARLSIVGGQFTSSTAGNDGNLSMIDGQLTLFFSSFNDTHFDAIDSTLNFGTGGDGFENIGTMNLIDCTVNGDLINDPGAVLNIAGMVVFNGIVTSSANIATSGLIQLAGANASLAEVSGTGSMTVQNAATTGALTLNALTVNGALTIRPGSAVSKVNVLAIAHTGSGATASYSGKIDLANNRMIVQTADAPGKAAAILAINEALLAGKGTGNTWTGAGGITSAAVAADPQRLTIGVFDNKALGRSNFAGGTGNVDANSLLISPALIGDANLDGIVNFNDMLAVTGNWNTQGLVNGVSTIDFAHGDLNGDGIVNFNDMLVVTGHWNNTSSTFNMAAAVAEAFANVGVDPGTINIVSPAAVPEPASASLMVLGAGFLVRRRKRAS